MFFQDFLQVSEFSALFGGCLHLGVDEFEANRLRFSRYREEENFSIGVTFGASERRLLFEEKGDKKAPT